MTAAYRDPSDPQEMAARIRAARAWAGMKQKELGTATGRSVTTVERMEKGDASALGRTPAKRARVRLEVVKATGVPLSFFLHAWGERDSWQDDWDERRRALIGAADSDAGLRLGDHLRRAERGRRLREIELEYGVTADEIRDSVLTAREWEVSDLVLEARAVPAIAERLGITEDEVEEIRRSCRAKLSHLAAQNSALLDPEDARRHLGYDMVAQLEEVEGRPLDLVDDRDQLADLEEEAREALRARGGEMTWQAIAEEVLAIAMRRARDEGRADTDERAMPDPAAVERGLGDAFDQADEPGAERPPASEKRGAGGSRGRRRSQ
jgi:transcriptional regulator with XRE-family HTH domain